MQPRPQLGPIAQWIFGIYCAYATLGTIASLLPGDGLQMIFFLPVYMPWMIFITFIPAIVDNTWLVRLCFLVFCIGNGYLLLSVLRAFTGRRRGHSPP